MFVGRQYIKYKAYLCNSNCQGNINTCKYYLNTDMTILAYFDKPMSTYLSSLFINSLKLIVFGTLYKYSGINFSFHL